MPNSNESTKAPNGYPALYALSKLLFVIAVVGIAALLGTDIIHHLAFTDLHERLDAWPLMAIGLSYIALQLAEPKTLINKIKGIFLGAAFLLWGGEQLIPHSALATLMDEGAVTIFVVDVSFIIWERLSTGEVADLL